VVNDSLNDIISKIDEDKKIYFWKNVGDTIYDIIGKIEEDVEMPSLIDVSKIPIIQDP